jgi:hypothetical protein
MMNPHGSLRSWSVCPHCLDPYDMATCPRCGEFGRSHGPPPRSTPRTAPAPPPATGRVLPLLGLALPILSGIVGLLLWSL